MSQVVNSPEKTSPTDVLAERRLEASRFAREQIKADAWTSLEGTKPVGIMELRGCMCRWPINAEQDGATRYCGSPSATEYGYCAAHRKIAHSPARVRAPMPARDYS
jgi:hypothetical protein